MHKVGDALVVVDPSLAPYTNHVGSVVEVEHGDSENAQPAVRLAFTTPGLASCWFETSRVAAYERQEPIEDTWTVPQDTGQQRRERYYVTAMDFAGAFNTLPNIPSYMGPEDIFTMAAEFERFVTQGIGPPPEDDKHDAFGNQKD